MYSSLWTFPSGFLSEFDRLHREFDEHFGAYGGPSSIRSVAPGTFPAINVGNTPTSVEVYAFAPGLDASKIEVSIDKGLLTIAGERAAELPANGGNVDVYTRERFSGAFKRVISLPEQVDASAVQATYRDGVLKILVPKQERAKSRRVEVKELEQGR